jgi:hypothetical protein
MGTATGAGWRDALSAVEQSIGDCLTALDRYEAAFGRVLAETGTPPPPPPEPPDRSAEWAAKLAAAGDRADEAERLLAEGEAVWNRWRAALAAVQSEK